MFTLQKVYYIIIYIKGKKQTRRLKWTKIP